MPNIQFPALSSQPQENTRSQAGTASEQLTGTPFTQAKPSEGPIPLSSGSSANTGAPSQLVRAPVVNAPIVVVKQPQPTKSYSEQTSWKQYK